MRRWLFIIGVIAGVTAIVLYLVNPGLFSSAGYGDPVAVVAPPPTETPAPTPEPTLMATQVPTAPTLEPLPAPSPSPTLESTPPPTAEPAPMPSPLLAYGGWKLDCPDCPVVLLDTKEPKVIGAASLRPGEKVRVAGCTRAQTTVPRRYVFEAVDGHYSGVVTFDPEEHPGSVHALRCFEMLGEYRETSQFAVSVQLAGGQWEYELIRGEEAQAATSPHWEQMGVLNEFVADEWTEVSKIEYAVALRARTDPAYATRLASVMAGTPPPPAVPEPSPTPPSIPTPIPAPTANPRPALPPRARSTPRPTITPRPMNTPRPTSTLSPTPTPAPTYAEALASAKALMLELINETRVAAGSPPLVLGSNRAAQVHADNALAGCFSGHWGLDGTKPYMRYTLAGGHQSNAENVSGLDVCIRAGQGYAANSNIDYEVRQTMDGFLGSPGHLRAIIDPAYRKVSLGIAWDRYNFKVVQQFEGDYVKFERFPVLENGVLSFEGSLHNGAALVPGGVSRNLGVQIYYDPPLQTLTRGQVTRTYSSGYVTLTASVRGPAPAGSNYTSNGFTQEICSGPDPYDVPPDAQAPQTYSEARQAHLLASTKPLTCRTSRIPWLDASRWKLSKDHFDVQVSLKSVLRTHGPGVYSIVLWADVGGEQEVVGEYSIFHETKPPDEYGSWWAQ